MTAAKKLEVVSPSEDVTAEDDVVTDPGIPMAVEGEATRLIRLTLSKIDENLDVTKRARGAARRLADVCTPPQEMRMARARK